MKKPNGISDFEKSKRWRVSARYRDGGSTVAILTGIRSRASEFYLYESGWTFANGGMKASSAQEIIEMFANGELEFLKGEIPETPTQGSQL